MLLAAPEEYCRHTSKLVAQCRRRTAERRASEIMLKVKANW
jgi:hypothetical protein